MNNNTDRLTSLPESIRKHILSFLPIQDIIRIQTLSTKWLQVCSSLTHYDFNQLSFPKTLLYNFTFKDFIYQTLLQRNSSSDISKLKLSLHVDHSSVLDIDTWITFAIRHNVQEIYFIVLSGKIGTFPTCLYTSKNLCKLYLENVTKLKVPLNLRSIPNLRSLSVVSVEFWDDKEAFRLFSSCGLLEELTIINCYFKNHNVMKFPGKNLKYLKLLGLSRFHVVDIDFPNLRRIVYSGRVPNISLETLLSLHDVEFDLGLPPRNANGEDRDLIEHHVSKILEGLRNVQKLVLEGLCIEFLTRDSDLLERLPASYSSLNHLKLALYPDTNQVNVVMLLLRRFPNLQSLCIYMKMLTLTNMVKIGGHQQSHEPSTESTLNRLREVEIKYFGEGKNELDLVKYLIGNGTAMEEMTITYSQHKKTDRTSREATKEKIMTFIRASSKVEITVS
ncbi:F-box/LRR-repeat protein [Thalictrum thalictroides]|uniref:F-box/LRR-repeat protein n=1 Tax=Thalictrum thalictroides TaxID=46969 RepID=A0A7J6URY5_THATH|nr:F-box/LRR-repeat protein [Thalictrum thalictroides]